MRAGNFNIKDYLEKLYEEADDKIASSTPMMTGGEDLSDADGIVIPEQNKKSYDWLKKEYQKAQTEVKVEIKMGGAKFEPGYDLQTDLDSVKDFKPGMFGEVKTADMKGNAPKQGEMPKGDNLDSKKETSSFTKKEGEPAKKEENAKTKSPSDNINNKSEKPTSEEKPEKPEKPEVKKIDLKTKKTSEQPEKSEKKEEKDEKEEKDDSKTKKNDKE
jgi:hypothetical protein